MKNKIRIGLSLFFSTVLFGNRPYSEELSKTGKVKWDSYELPFMQVTTAVTLSDTPTEIVKQIRNWIIKKKTDPKISMPEIVHKNDQLEAIENCTQEKCNMKLSNGKEKKMIQDSKEKVVTYLQLVKNRLNTYLEKKRLMGYEERENNNETIAQLLGAIEFFKTEYPKEYNYYSQEIWKDKEKPKWIKSTYLTSEITNLGGEKMQPIWRIAEVSEVPEKEGTLFVELHIYTNHFFDSSIRIIEVLPSKKLSGGSTLVLTDVMEIDELKKSGLIRTLFKGKMTKAVFLYQENELKSILSN